MIEIDELIVTEQLLDHTQHRYYGKYRGLVTDNQDKTNRGRLKVSVELLENQEVWAMPCVPYAGEGVGLYTLPENGTGVWVEFERGDPSYPIWTGFFWADNELPKDNGGTGATPPIKILRTKEGLMVTLNDSSKKISVSDKDGKNHLTIEVNSGQITVQSTTKVVVEAPQIELVEGATHPLVFGDDLLQYLNQLVNLFNAHLHPGELALGVFPVTPAPPVAPFTPATPALLSVKVKTG